MAGGRGGPGAPDLMQPPRPLLRPHALPPGSTIGICAPSGPVLRPECLEAGIAWLEREGYTVRCSENVKARRGYLAGDDATRLGDLMELVRDPEVACIIAARGGYGLPRLLRDLDPEELRAARKPIVGYSDATALLLFLYARAGLASLHGPMLERDDAPEGARARLLALLAGEPPGLVPLAGRPLAPGSVRGRLVGGNLKGIVASLGTPWEIDTREAILFFEEVNEEPYALDRSLVQLRDARKLEAAAGVAVGQLVACASERYPDVSAFDVVSEILGGAVAGPLVVDLPFGHVADHRALGVGGVAELDGDRGTLALVEPVVERA